MHPFYPQLSPVKKAVGIYQTGFPGPDRFNFGTGKYDAGIIFFEKFVPVKVFLNEKGYAKLRIALAKGKKEFDKRESLKLKDAKKDMERAMKR